MTFYEEIVEVTKAERAEFENIPFVQEGVRGNISLESYVAFLEQAYHHVRHTTPLLMAAGARTPERLGWVRKYLAEYIEEEIGHDEWILNDIKACGFDAEAVRSSEPAFATELMVSFLYDNINRKNPLGLFGMVFVLEGMSAQLATGAAGLIQKGLGLPDEAFTYLVSHGTLDLDHIKFFEKIMNMLDNDEDKACVIHCAKAMYKLYGDIFRTLELKTTEPKLKTATA